MATQGGYEGGVREATHRFREGRGGEFFEGAGERMSEVYDQASHWMQDNRGKMLTAVGVLAVVGFFGYLLGRKSLETSDIQNI